MFIGIDQSYTNTGFCVIDYNGLVFDFGTIKTTDKDGDHFDRCKIISDQVIALAFKHIPTAIAIEGLAYGMRGDATRSLAGLQFVVITALREHAFNPEIVAPLTLKKFATGTGKADKKEMIASLPTCVSGMFVSGGFKKTTGLADLADAYFLAMHAKKKFETSVNL